jgi:hypothetical protein
MLKQASWAWVVILLRMPHAWSTRACAGWGVDTAVCVRAGGSQGHGCVLAACGWAGRGAHRGTGVVAPCRCAAPHACLFCGCHMRGAHVHVQVGAWTLLCASGLGAPRDMGVCWLSRQGCSPKGHQRESHCPIRLVLSPCVLLRNE